MDMFSAFRLGSELKSGSVILKPKSQYKIWFSDMLIPGTHYIEVDSMLKDLVEKVNWCRENDAACKQIAINAQKFYDTYLNKTAILRYFAQQLYNIRGYRSDNFLNYSAVTKMIEQKSGKSSSKSGSGSKSGSKSSSKSSSGSKSSSLSKSINIAIITIFRDNKDYKYYNQRLNFIKIMSKLFESIPHKIIIVEQGQDNYGFNIGKLKNIGFQMATSIKDIKFSHFIFTDIDHIPDTVLYKYYLTPPEDNSPMSLAALGTRWQNEKTV